jgi:hypothetical protein
MPIASANQEDISSLDEDEISPRPLDSRSDVSLPDRAIVKALASPPAAVNDNAYFVGAAVAFAKLPPEVIELYVSPWPLSDSDNLENDFR